MTAFKSWRLVVDVTTNRVVFHCDRTVNTTGILCQAWRLSDLELIVEAVVTDEFDFYNACYVIVRAPFAPDTEACTEFLAAWYASYHREFDTPR